MRKTVFFQRIGWGNVAYAWLLSFRHEVIAWKIEMLPHFLSRRFARLQAYERFSRDEKLKMQEAFFDLWRDHLLPYLAVHRTCRATLENRTIDFSRNVWQIYGIDLERLFLLAHTASLYRSGAASLRIVCPWPACTLGRELLARCAPDTELSISRTHGFLDALNEWVVTAGHWYLTLSAWVTQFLKPRLDAGGGRLFWTGFTPRDMPAADHRLNLAWAAQYGHIAPEKALYLLPSKPSAGQRQYFARHRIAWGEPGCEYRLVGTGDALGAIGRAMVQTLRGLFLDPPGIGPYRARFAARGFIWAKIALKCAPRAYLTTVSSFWPERPDVAVLKAFQVRTVTWAYSANSLRFSMNYAAFRDVAVDRSIPVTDEFWAWSEAYRQWLQKRQVAAGGDGPIPIVVQGAMMCGDARHLRLSPAQARRLLGIERPGFVLSAFDVPAVTEMWRLRSLSGTPAIELDYAEAFFLGVRAVLEAYPQVTVALKLKHGALNPLRPAPPALLALAAENSPWMQRGRILLLDIDVDPFLPIAVGDAAIGMAFTSPVLAAIGTGRGGLYYDPSGYAACPSEPAFRDITAANTGQLLNAVGGWLRGERVPVSAGLSRLIPGPGPIDFRRLGITGMLRDELTAPDAQ